MSIRNNMNRGVHATTPKTLDTSVEVSSTGSSQNQPEVNHQFETKNPAEITLTPTTEVPTTGQSVLSTLLSGADEAKEETLGPQEQIYLEMIDQDYENFQHLPKELKADKDFVLLALEKHPSCLRFVDDSLKQDRELCLIGLKKSVFSFADVPESFVADRNFVFEAIKENGHLMRSLPETYQEDREVALLGAQQGYLSTDPPTWINDKEIVIEYIQNSHYGLSVDKLGTELQEDRDVLKALVTKKSKELLKMDPKHLDDREIVLLAVQNDKHGHLMKSLPEKYFSDPEIVIAAFENFNSISDFTDKIPTALLHTPEVALAAVKGDGDLLEKLPDELKDNKEIVLAAVQESGLALQYASDKLKADRDVVFAAIMDYPSSLKFAVSELQNDPELVFQLLEKKGGLALNAIPSHFLEKREFAMAAVSKYFSDRQLTLLPERFQKDPELMLKAVQDDPDLFRHIDESLHAHPEIALASLASREEHAFMWIDPSLKMNLDFVLKAVKLRPSLFSQIDPVFQKLILQKGLDNL